MGAMEKFEGSVAHKAIEAAVARMDCYHASAMKQRAWAKKRWTTDRWLDENEREWMALDRVCRSRPWAKNRDTPFAYPFRKSTDEMRKQEGPWLGDDAAKVSQTRGAALSDVVTQVITPQEYPPDWRVLLFTPEFGNVESFDLDNWSYLEPEDKVDVWVICWQGWEKFDEMVEQVLYQVLTFGDGGSTVWFAEGFGAIVAYEVAKRMEKFETSNFPHGLVVSDCPAPHLLASTYKPYEIEDWGDAVSKTTEKQRKIVNDEVAMMKAYTVKHGDDKKLLMPIKAFFHEEDKFGVTEENVKAWEEYTSEDGFELLDALDEEELDGYVTGKGYVHNVDPAIVSTISELGALYPRLPKEPNYPDLGDTDGPLPTEVDIVVIGTGINGIYQAMDFKTKTSKSVLIVDRSDGIGGVWKHYGNDFSRVNTSEIGYRWIDKSGPWKYINEDHTPKHDMIADMYRMAAFNKDSIRFHIDVSKVETREDGKHVVTMKHTKKGTENKVVCEFVSIHTNRRIGKARNVDWTASEKFKGKICYGYRNEVAALSFWNKNSCIIGAGAFAFENIRTSIEHGSHFCTLLGRRDGTTCPKWIDMIAFLRPLDENYNTSKAGAAISFEVWQRCYDQGNLHQPSCWKEGMLKPNNHTISVSDLGFIAGYHGLFNVKVGEIDHITDDGKGVELKSGERMDLDIIVKCTGFHLNDEVEPMTGHSKMYPSGLIKFNVQYGAEPLLDAGQFGAAKGNTDVDVNWGITKDELDKGMEVFKKKGISDKLFAPIGHPFGSGQAGPTMYLSAYMAWLVENPDCQKALIEMSGEAEQNVVEFWASTQGKLALACNLRTIAALRNYE